MRDRLDVCQEISEKIARVCCEYELSDSIFAIQMSLLAICAQSKDPEGLYQSTIKMLQLLKDKTFKGE